MPIMRALPKEEEPAFSPFNSSKRLPTEINTPQAATSDMTVESAATAAISPKSILRELVPDQANTAPAMRVGIEVASRATVNAKGPSRKKTVLPMELANASS